jgi:hypothetical protein
VPLEPEAPVPILTTEASEETFNYRPAGEKDASQPPGNSQPPGD